MDHLLDEVKPMLLTEVNSRWLHRAESSVDELVGILSAYGYRGYTVGVHRHGLRRSPALAAMTPKVAYVNVIWANPANPVAERLGRLVGGHWPAQRE